MSVDVVFLKLVYCGSDLFWEASLSALKHHISTTTSLCIVFSITNQHPPSHVNHVMGFHCDTFHVSKQAPFLICSQCQPATRYFLSKYQSLERLIQADRLSHPFMTSRFELRFLYTQFPQANQRPRHRARLFNNASLISPMLIPSLAQTLNGVNPRVGFVHQAVNQPPFQNPVTPHFQSHFHPPVFQ